MSKSLETQGIQFVRMDVHTCVQSGIQAIGKVHENIWSVKSSDLES